MAQPFDTERLELRGVPVPLVEDVKLSTAGATGATAAFSASDNGIVAYQTASRLASHPVAFDRTGRQLAGLAPPADYSDLAISPNGRQLVLSVRDPARPTGDLWLYGVDGGRGQRLTFDANDEFAPVWSPDGTRVLFSAMGGSFVDLYVKEIDRASDPARLDVDTPGIGRYAADWSRDDRFVMYIGGGRVIGRSDVWVAPIATPANARPLLESSFLETHARFAPGGHWFAYASNETGQMEVYVDRFPERGAKRRVSTSGRRMAAMGRRWK